MDINRGHVFIGIGLAAAVTAICAITQGRPTLRRAVITGDSMLPAFRPGDRVLILGPWPPRPGHVVAVSDPRQAGRLMVKRILSLDGAVVDVRGDNPGASTDSRHFGPVPRGNLAGRVVYRYWPAERTGWLP